MAERQQQQDRAGRQEDPVEVTQTAEDAAGGVEAGQVPRMADRPKDQQEEHAVFKQDLKRGALKEPSHPNDKTSYPGPEMPVPIERPPFTTGRPDVPIVQSALLGANEHMPPDPAEYDAAGRPRDAGDRS